MRPIALLALALLATSCSSNTAASNEPTGFRDIPWGATEETWRKKADVTRPCVFTLRGDPGDKRCEATGRIQIDGIATEAIDFYFRDDKLVAWTVVYDRKSRGTMGAALTEKYGKPTRDGQGGAAWIGARAEVTVESLSGERDYLLVITRGELDRQATDQKRAAEKASKGF